jgi:AcrR family transcriptional regulator
LGQLKRSLPFEPVGHWFSQPACASGLTFRACTFHVYGVYIACVQRIRMSRSTNNARAKPSTAASILVAARQLLDKEGLAAVAMRSVSERVGITPMAATRVQALQYAGGMEHRLMQVVDVFLNAALQFPNLYKLMFLVPREGARVYPRDFKAGRSPTFNPTVTILKEAMTAGELRPDDPIEIAFELSALSHGLIVLYLGGRVHQSEKQFRTLYQRSFRRYLDGLRP